MKHPLENLQGELDFFLGQLRQGAFLSMTPEEILTLEQEGALLSRKLSSMEASFLVLGLLGGTGVGKSTIMNALAMSEIALESHRRPQTDRVLIYRHVHTHQVPDLHLEDIPWEEVTHDADSIRHILLCDLPDFDSLAGEHRQMVLQFLDHLDILIWVSSPEKYGDSRFYEFLDSVPKARQNFIFVLNKIDLLFQGKEPQEGYRQLDQVLRSYVKHISDHGIAEPLVHAVSAKEAFFSSGISPWNQLTAFRHEIFQQRDMKQIAAVKSANLDAEVGRFISSFEKEARSLEKFIRILEETSMHIEERRSSWEEAGEEALRLWLEELAKSGSLDPQGEPFALVGPGYLLSLVFQQGKRPGGIHGNRDLSVLKPSEEIISIFQRRFEWVEEHLAHSLQRRNLAPGFLDRVKERIDVKNKFEVLGENFFSAVATYASRPSSRFRVFRIVQWSCYLLVFVLFLFAVGGEKAWQDVLTDPGPAEITRLLLSMIHNLFDIKGLAALGSYVLINLFLGLRFFRQHKKSLQRASGKKTRALQSALSKQWEESLNALIRDLHELKKDAGSQLSALKRVQTERPDL
jgi:GTPase Era involved in 16S rRNA processing